MEPVKLALSKCKWLVLDSGIVMVPGGTLVVPPPKMSFLAVWALPKSVISALPHWRSCCCDLQQHDSDVVVEYHNSMISIMADSVTGSRESGDQRTC